MTRFVAVIHRWHVDSKGFTAHDLSATDRKNAEGEAAVLARNAEGNCRSADYHVVEIGESELLLPRQLTWKERLTGRMEQPQ